MAQPAAHHLPDPHPALHDVLVTDQAGPWRTHLIHHLDPPQRAALHQTCTALRDAVLAAAPALTLTIPLQLAAFQSISPTLQRQPQQTIHLTLDMQQQPQDVSVDTALSMLGASIAVHSLNATSSCPAIANASTITHAFPLLIRLVVPWGPHTQLAALTAAALPRLRELNLKADMCGTGWFDCEYERGEQLSPEVTRLVRDFWQQLSKLHVSRNGWLHMYYHLPKALLPTTVTAHHLTHLCLPAKLRDADVRTLLEHAPLLEELDVDYINLKEDHRSTLCGWRKVTFAGRIEFGVSTEWKLPRSRDRDLLLVSDRGLGDCLDMTQDCVAELRNHYQGLRLEVDLSFEVRSLIMDEDAEALELREVLGFMREVFVDYDKIMLTLDNFTMSDALIAADGVLSQVPACTCWMHVLGCWDADHPEKYRDLLSRFPRTLEHICLRTTDQATMPPAVIEQIYLGCPTDRTEDRPLEVLLGEEEDWDVVEELLEQVPQQPHVEVNVYV